MLPGSLNPAWRLPSCSQQRTGLVQNRLHGPQQRLLFLNHVSERPVTGSISVRASAAMAAKDKKCAPTHWLRAALVVLAYIDFH